MRLERNGAVMELIVAVLIHDIGDAPTSKNHFQVSLKLFSSFFVLKKHGFCKCMVFLRCIIMQTNKVWKKWDQIPFVHEYQKKDLI